MMRKALIGAAVMAVVVSISGPIFAQQAAPRVVVAEAELAQVAEAVTFNGRVVAVQKVDLRARIGGFVEEMGFTEGRLVAEGDVLFRLEDDSYTFALAQAEAQVDAAQAAAELARLERDRQQELVSRNAAAEAVLQRAEADFQAKDADVRRLQAMRDQAALNLSYATITAPFDGRVGRAAVDVGALVGPETGALLTLVRVDPMTVEFAVPERVLLAYEAQAREAGGPQTGAITLVRSDGSTYPQAGSFDFADVEVNQATDTVMIRAEFPNPEGSLTDGALVSVTLTADPGEPQLTVPQIAVQRDLTGAFVLVVDDAGVVEQRRVEVARQAQGVAVIASGLEPGEMVVTEGINKVRPGITVDAALAGQG
jgi:membrane fusion protein (multidrug efflux system)